MQLVDIRTEVYNKGFDAGLFPASRLNQFINDGYLNIFRRVQFYAGESTQDFSTSNGVATYPWPTNSARIRFVWDTTRQVRLLPVSLREMDNSGLPGTGPPQYYALEGSNFHIWPTPDGIYNLETRFWLMPQPLVNDADVPVFPADYHNLLVRYTTAECYKSEDDFGTAAQWEADFEKDLARFMADQKFPDSETPDVVKSFWDQERGLTQKGWSLWGWL